jgi:hypothetical protein
LVGKWGIGNGRDDRAAGIGAYQRPQTPIKVGGEEKVVDLADEEIDGNVLDISILDPSVHAPEEATGLGKVMPHPIPLCLLPWVVGVVAFEPGPLGKVVGNIKTTVVVASILIVDEGDAILLKDQVPGEEVIVGKDDGGLEGLEGGLKGGELRWVGW